MYDESLILFVLYFTSNHSPEGADQVEAAYECYKYALENENKLLTHRRGGEVLCKIKKKYCN